MTELPLQVDFDPIYNFPSFYFYIFLKFFLFLSIFLYRLISTLVYKTLNQIWNSISKVKLDFSFFRLESYNLIVSVKNRNMIKEKKS